MRPVFCVWTTCRRTEHNSRCSSFASILAILFVVTAFGVTTSSSHFDGVEDWQMQHKRICDPEERLVVSFKQPDGSKEYQIALYIQTGQIRMSWLDIGDWATKNKTIVGLSHGLTPWWGGERLRRFGFIVFHRMH